MEDILDNQKKAFETWKDWSDQWMKNFSGKTPPSSGADFFVPWMDMQRKWMDETMKMGAKPNLESAPKMWKEWMEMQAGRSWQNWMEESNKWIRQNILDKIPSNMKPHFNNFTALYDEMGKYWEPIQRMIQFGTYSKETTDQFFGPDAYRRIVSLFLGFKPMDNTAKLVEDVNTFFEDFISGMQKTTPGTHEFMNSWTRFFRDWGRQTGHPGLQAVAEVTQLVDKGINSFYHIAGPSEELAMAKLLKDIQFTYTAFLLKSSEMQHVLLDAGQFAMPDTLKEFYDEFQKSQKMPNYTEFFNRYANNLEDYLLEVLESDEYSKLQADVSKVGIAVKSKMDALIELAFNDFPFLMKSFADEVAQENKSLRRKVRDLENRLYALESSIFGGSAVPKGDATKEVKPETKTTARKAVKK